MSTKKYDSAVVYPPDRTNNIAGIKLCFVCKHRCDLSARFCPFCGNRLSRTRKYIRKPRYGCVINQCVMYTYHIHLICPESCAGHDDDDDEDRQWVETCREWAIWRLRALRNMLQSDYYQDHKIVISPIIKGDK